MEKEKKVELLLGYLRALIDLEEDVEEDYYKNMLRNRIERVNDEMEKEILNN